MKRYAIISAVRDEAEHMAATIGAVAEQTVRPVTWVIVDDGSTDGTGEILDRCAAEHSWIRVVHRANRGFRKAGGGVVEAFNAGYQVLEESGWEFIVKLDGDLTFAPDYFEECFERFDANPRLGIAGGGVYHKTSEGLQLEVNPVFHVRGATKIYRRACWEAIGGLWPAAGWDTIDEVKANMLGWRTQSFPELRLVHHRFTGAAEGTLRDRVKHGVACHTVGYHPFFVAASCAFRIVQRPYVFGSLAIGYGFVKAYLTKQPRVNDQRLVRYVRAQQLRRLCGLETIWR